MTRRVVITGLGSVTPLGNTVHASWEKIKAGQSGAGRITHFDTSNFLVQIAAELKDFNAEDYMSPKEARQHDTYQHYVIAAAQEAVADAGLEVNDANAHRTGVIIGSAVGGMNSFVSHVEQLLETGNPRKISPFAIPTVIVGGGGNTVSIRLGAKGPSFVPISACATGADCIGTAFDLIRSGRIDQALAGAGEAPIVPLGIAAFDRIGAASRENDNPQGAMRPFSRDRSGLVFAEGSGVLVLEELEVARARGARVLAEMVGYGASSDAFHRTAPDPGATGAADALKLSLLDARLNPQDIDYINAHGTATLLNDVMETQAVKAILGQHAYEVPMSSTKSMTGHAMGATAAMEAIFSVLSIRDQVAPPTINYQDPDPECDLDYVPNEARDLRITHVMSNSFGFGGHNSSLIFRQFTG